MNIAKQILVILWALVGVHITITWVLAIWRGRRARKQMGNASWRFQQIPTFGLSGEIKTGIANTLGLGEDVRQPTVSILVPAWNEKGTVEKCIDSLRNLNYPYWETLILAGGSDGTYEATRKFIMGDPRFRILERRPEPKNAAINRGIHEAMSEIIVILDADSIVEPNWLTALIEPLTEGAAASFGMHYPSKSTWISTEEHMEIIESYHILGTMLGQGCSSLAVRKKVFKKIGSLPTDAYSWEDTDIGIRLAKAGEKVAFVPSAQLTNERPATFKDYWKTAVRVHRAHLALLWHWRGLTLRNPKWIIFQSYLHAFSVLLLSGLIVGIIIALAVPYSRPLILQIVALVLVWMLVRRAALAGEISAYTGKAGWLLEAWIPPVLLLVQLITSNYGLFTFWKAVPFDYKGHRNLQATSASASPKPEN
jgi:cellulose synthase/poly-beta-1,6-N-acetylglucosamine synthase-like glycosyltransferase